MVIPLGIDFLEWAAQMVIDFPQANIPNVYHYENWREWGNHLIQSVPFAENQTPDTAAFPDWQSWAQAVYYNMSNEL